MIALFAFKTIMIHFSCTDWDIINIRNIWEQCRVHFLCISSCSSSFGWEIWIGPNNFTYHTSLTAVQGTAKRLFVNNDFWKAAKKEETKSLKGSFVPIAVRCVFGESFQKDPISLIGLLYSFSSVMILLFLFCAHLHFGIQFGAISVYLSWCLRL